MHLDLQDVSMMIKASVGGESACLKTQWLAPLQAED